MRWAIAGTYASACQPLLFSNCREDAKLRGERRGAAGPSNAAFEGLEAAEGTQGPNLLCVAADCWVPDVTRIR